MKKVAKWKYRRGETNKDKDKDNGEIEIDIIETHGAAAGAEEGEKGCKMQIQKEEKPKRKDNGEIGKIETHGVAGAEGGEKVGNIET